MIKCIDGVVGCEIKHLAPGNTHAVCIDGVAGCEVDHHGLPGNTHVWTGPEVDASNNDGWGWCTKCKKSWKYVKWVDVSYSDGSGCFALCTECWENSSVEDRKMYYMDLICSWKGAEITAEKITTLCDNIESMDKALKRGTRVKFEWTPCSWIGSGSIGSNKEDWKYTVCTGTIVCPTGLRFKHGIKGAEKVLHYDIQPDSANMLLNCHVLEII